MRDPWETEDTLESEPLQPVTPKPKADLSAANVKKTFSPKPNKAPAPEPAAGTLPGLWTRFNRDHLLEGILWAEILGKPLSKRRPGTR